MLHMLIALFTMSFVLKTLLYVPKAPEFSKHEQLVAIPSYKFTIQTLSIIIATKWNAVYSYSYGVAMQYCIRIAIG